MDLNWRARLRQEPEWQDVSRWPFVDTQALAPSARRGYMTNLRIVAAVLDNTPMKDVAQAFQISLGRVTQVMNRCLAGDADKPPALSKALIPNRHVRQSRRNSEIGTLTRPSGSRCAFNHVLHSVPGLYDHLMTQVRWAANRHRRGQNLTPRAFHASFIAYLNAQNWPQDRYPFTTQSRGYESCRRWLNEALSELQMPKTQSRVLGPNLPPVGAFHEIHIDEAHIDCHGAAAVVLHGQMKPVRLARISLLLARDRGTGCYLAGTFALAAHPNADDILGLLEQLVQPWTPRSLATPGLTYPGKACFPSALDEAFCRPAFGIVRLDNALSHLSHQVRRMVCDHLGATVNFGLPKNPKARACIEQAFRRLNVDIHRFQSTTGSHPTDPNREPSKLKKEPPFVSLRALEEAVSVLLAEYNVRPLASQGGITPLEQMQYQMANHLLPLRATRLGPGLGPYQRCKQVTVRKGFSADAPRINFEGCQYTGEALNDARLINQKVTITFDSRDIRLLQVVTLDGQELGQVQVVGTWISYAHSISMRKRANRLVREHALSRVDPLGGYFDYLLAHRHLPREALSMVRFASAEPSPPSPESDKEPATSDETRATSSALADALKRLPDWTPDMAKSRGQKS